MTATLAPRPPEGLAAGAAISVAAHAALAAALAFAVNWRLPAPQPVAAELWSAVPQAAAPPEATAPPPAPAPPPAEPTPAPTPQPPKPSPAPAQRDADIALERERQQQRERERERERQEKVAKEKAAQEKAAREREARQKAAQDKAAQDKAKREQAEREKAERVEEARLARQREENLKRLLGQIPAGGSPSGSGAGTAAVDAVPSATYAGRLVQAIFPNIVFTDTLPGNPAAVVEVRAGPQGSIIGRRLVTSSGHRDWDEAVLRAIDRTGTLPRDVDGRVPPVITITFRPR